MKILSDFNTNEPDNHLSPGGYEWWYFDGEDTETGFRFVVIFYTANPFSIRNIKYALEHGKYDNPLVYPAVSISVYENGEPVYYSFMEFGKRDVIINTNPFSLQIGSHKFCQTCTGGQQRVDLSLCEKLPGGDAFSAKLTFLASSATDFNRLKKGQNRTGHSGKSHIWNLAMPRARVKGKMHIRPYNNQERSIPFLGSGYHDHNMGHEPMKKGFTDWYWGRFHFSGYTLIYYAMNEKESVKSHSSRNFNAWLLDGKTGKLLAVTKQISCSAPQPTLFGLISNRKICIKGLNGREVTIQQSEQLDNGPFYQRFLSSAILHDASNKTVDAVTGLTEYIYPRRIYCRLFWPLIRMRLRHDGEKPHWVQKYPALYRWTW